MTEPCPGFGLENLPYCSLAAGGKIGVRYGGEILVLDELFEGVPGNLAELFRDGRGRALEYRARLRAWLAAGRKVASQPASETPLAAPFRVGNFVDFYASREHATNVGRRFRDPANPLPENWLYLPAGYNGRASNVGAATEVRRPRGQFKNAAGQVEFGPTKELDFEAELGYFLCPAAEDGLAGFVMLNDWSARDVQRWEYVPLGPFLGKAFATTVSPYLVLPEALAAYRVVGPRQMPVPLPHLRVAEPRNWDITIEVRRAGVPVTRTNAKYLYWSVEQQIAHLRSGGVELQVGDLCGTGTISGPEAGSEGSLLERGGPYLADGERLEFRAWAGAGEGMVSFGEMEMTIGATATR